MTFFLWIALFVLFFSLYLCIHSIIKTYCSSCKTKFRWFEKRYPIKDGVICDKCASVAWRTAKMRDLSELAQLTTEDILNMIHNNDIQESVKSDTGVQSDEEKRHIKIDENNQREREFLDCVENLISIPVDDTLPTIKRNVYTKIPTYAISEFEHGAVDYIVVDVETTGLKPNTDRIVEICLVKFRNFVPVEYMISLVNPGRNIPVKASDVNGITNEMVADAPMFQNIAQSVMNFIGKEKFIVAHNMPFDLEFLYCSGVNTFYMDDRKYIDTLSMARNCLSQNGVERYTLSFLADYFGILHSKRHRRHPQGGPKSLSDCIATGFLLQRLMKQLCDAE